MCAEHQVITDNVRENLRKNNKWDTSDKKATCAKTGDAEYCNDCLGYMYCDYVSSDIL